MRRTASVLVLVFNIEFFSVFFLSAIDLRVYGRPMRWTKRDLCQAIPSPADLAAVPHNVPLENTTFAPLFLYKQKLELVNYFHHKTVFVSTIEESNAPVGIYIPEARQADAATIPSISETNIGRFKSPSPDLEIYKCIDTGIQIVLKFDDDGVDDHGVTLEWHPPNEDFGPVDIYITKISYKKLKHRIRRLGQTSRDR
ncbi:uncharacterized protein LOC121425914 [Lytechinus variegatus]|uniref:uncharacterized protein LOC121425914 n=1 Tax=Lytechinus variegatus TaxID=7654 RepID=UPI001BB0E1BF|nr:uncharacterized protein LOC121425914 [Lytechinus variegatus]